MPLSRMASFNHEGIHQTIQTNIEQPFSNYPGTPDNSINPNRGLSVPSSTSMPENPHIDLQATGHESSEDKDTAIVRRERGGKRSYTTQKPGGISGSNASITPAMPQPQNQAGDHPAEHKVEEPQQSRWKRMLKKYGTVELENRGSVARDHLALGITIFLFLLCLSPNLRTHPSNLMQTILMLDVNRTNFPSLASHRPLLRKYRYRYNPTVPSKHKYIFTRS